MTYEVIRTKYLGQTGARGSRILARWGTDSASIPYPHAIGGTEERHAEAARHLCRKLGKAGTLIAAYDERVKGYCFVYVPPGAEPTAYPI